MARIPETEIDRIKTETDLVALIQSRGVALKQQGANWTGFCPFHDDKETPNLIVTPGKGLWRCMSSACGATGNPIQFVEKFDGLSFRHAFEILANGGKAAFEHSPDSPRTKATVPRLPCPLEDTAEDAKLLEQVADYYAKRLLAPENQAARDYLAARGLDDPELWQRYQIGFADRTLGLRIPEKNRRKWGKWGENGVSVQILTKIPSPLLSRHATESPYRIPRCRRKTRNRHPSVISLPTHPPKR